jgi:pimeloyl-ACP methyl ester carboxylesterase
MCADILESGAPLPDKLAGLRNAVGPSFAEAHPEQLEFEASRMSDSREGYAFSCLANANRDTTERLTELRQPVLWVGGSEDSPDLRSAPFRRVRNLEVHVIENVGHYLPMEAPGQLNALLAPFVDRAFDEAGEKAESL